MQKSILSLIAAAALSTGFAGAQTMPHHGHSATITGCLQKGDEAGEYSMKTGGKLYGLTSNKVQLQQHVGHTVTLHGTITPESAEKPEANEPASTTPDAGDIDMTVTSLKMVSSTCNQ